MYRVPSVPHYEVGPHTVPLKLILVIIRGEFTFNSSLVFILFYYNQTFLYFSTHINDKFYLSIFRLTNLMPVETNNMCHQA